MRLGVDLHVRLTEEGRRTHPAPTGGDTQDGGGEGGEGGAEEQGERKMIHLQERRK